MDLIIQLLILKNSGINHYDEVKNILKSDFNAAIANAKKNDWIQIEKGESQEIIAQMNKDIYDNILLHFKIGDEIWRKEIMEKAPDKSMYMYPIINIQQPTRYYIDVDGKRSSEYLISIYHTVLIIRLKKLLIFNREFKNY